jgi:hypothetical protein
MSIRHAFLLLAVASPAHADGDDDVKVRGFPSTSVTLGMTMHGGRLAGIQEGSFGPSLEFALGRSRWQYFVEGSAELARLGPEDNRIEGKRLRAGIGIRYLARSFELGRQGAVDMHLEGFSGVSRYDLDGMDRMTRPDLGLGVGYLIRVFHGDERSKQAGFRISARVVFSPTDRDTVLAACRGTCTMTESNTNTGLMAVFGGMF